MAKAIPLTSEALRAPQITPKAATPARSAWVQAAQEATGTTSAPTAEADATTTPASARKYGSNQPKPEQVPLQLRIPRDAARAIKIAAAEREMTISDFMLMCFATQLHAEKTTP